MRPNQGSEQAALLQSQSINDVKKLRKLYHAGKNKHTHRQLPGWAETDGLDEMVEEHDRQIIALVRADEAYC